MKKKLVFIAGLFASALLSAKIEMPKVFSDNMVLQRQMPVKIWGTAEPNAEVEVRFGGQSSKIRASEKGDWEALLKPMEASGTSRNLSVFENGEESKIIKNVLVGEVWIAGGQSNMELPMWECDTLEYAKQNADYPSIRYFRQPNVISKTPQKDSPEGSKWFACAKNTVGGMSGVAFHFAERLFKDLGVDGVNYCLEHSFAGGGSAAVKSQEGKLVCRHPNEIVNFNFLGNLTTCCLNWHLTPVFGNIENKTIKQMWESREKQSWNNIKRFNEIPCKNCSGAENLINGEIRSKRIKFTK